MLPLVLQSPMVADWEPASYDTRTYHTFDLRKGDQAFIVESSAFVRIGLRSLKRVQNPYQMGRFQLRKEQREFREDSIKMGKYYHPINSADEEIALTYNCDVRRYKHLYDNIHSEESCPKYYKNPDTAYAALSGQCENMTIIINYILVEQELLARDAVKRFHETERIPIFVAKL